jgi:hypothetical protein
MAKPRGSGSVSISGSEKEECIDAGVRDVSGGVFVADGGIDGETLGASFAGGGGGRSFGGGVGGKSASMG